MSKKTFTGMIIEAKCNKTVKVLVSSIVCHKVYQKFIRKCKKYIVHDEVNKCKVGDIVRIQEHSPTSSAKKWIVVS